MTSGDAPGHGNATASDHSVGRTAESLVEIHLSTDLTDLCPAESTLIDLTTRIMQAERLSFSRIGLVLADHELVTDLNRQYLDHDWHTDVLSFLIDEDVPIDGEVYVDVQTAAERCEEFGTSPAEEILRYVVHGLLHLAGHDDATDDDRVAMRALEDRYLGRDASAD